MNQLGYTVKHVQVAVCIDQSISYAPSA
jgi:hypothetical protein